MQKILTFKLLYAALCVLFCNKQLKYKRKVRPFKNRANTKHTKALLAANLKLLLYEEITA